MLRHMRLRQLADPPKPIHLVAALPDMGNVAGIAIDHIVQTLGMRPFAELLSSWPPYVIHKAGETTYRRSVFTFYKTPDNRDFIVLQGEYQPHEPSALYELCEDTISFSKQLGVTHVITLGAAHRENVLPEPRVFYAATQASLKQEAEKAGAIPLEGEGYITGFNGLLLGIAMENNMGGICLLGEIDNPEIRQPRASKTVLKVLSRMLGISNLDLDRLDHEAEKIRAMLSLEEEQRRLQRSFGRRPPGVM